MTHFVKRLEPVRRESQAMSNPKARAALQQQMKTAGVKAILVGSTVNPSLAGQIANDVGI